MHQCNFCSRHQVVVRHLPQIDSRRHFAKAKNTWKRRLGNFAAYQGKVSRPKIFPLGQDIVTCRNKPWCLLCSHPGDIATPTCSIQYHTSSQSQSQRQAVPGTKGEVNHRGKWGPWHILDTATAYQYRNTITFTSNSQRNTYHKRSLVILPPRLSSKSPKRLNFLDAPWYTAAHGTQDRLWTPTQITTSSHKEFVDLEVVNWTPTMGTGTIRWSALKSGVQPSEILSTSARKSLSFFPGHVSERSQINGTLWDGTSKENSSLSPIVAKELIPTGLNITDSIQASSRCRNSPATRMPLRLQNHQDSQTCRADVVIAAMAMTWINWGNTSVPQYRCW